VSEKQSSEKPPSRSYLEAVSCTCGWIKTIPSGPARSQERVLAKDQAFEEATVHALRHPGRVSIKEQGA